MAVTTDHGIGLTKLLLRTFMSKESIFAGITASLQHFTQVSRRPRGTLLSRWMLICRIVPKKYQVFTRWLKSRVLILFQAGKRNVLILFPKQSPVNFTMQQLALSLIHIS